MGEQAAGKAQRAAYGGSPRPTVFSAKKVGHPRFVVIRHIESAKGSATRDWHNGKSQNQ